MPMFREWVPKRIQPWIYIAQVICIQFSCGVYLGAMEAVRGTTALQLEELLMLLYAGLAGMAVWFPMLFRMKFRFTNQQLLITSAVVIAVCNFITMRTTNMAILLPVCFLVEYPVVDDARTRFRYLLPDSAYYPADRYHR